MNNIGHYIDKDSFIHHLHPFVKNSLFAFAFLTSLITNNTVILAILFLSTILVGVLAKLPIRDSLKTLKSAAFLIVVFSLIIWPFSLKEGTVILEIGSAEVYSVGLLYGISMSLRFSNIVLMSIYWMMFTSIGEITLGLIKARIPYKFAFSFSMALRFVPLVMKDLTIIKEAQKSRALEIDKGKLLEKIRKNVVLLIPLSSRSLGMINQIATSLESRGFGASNSRTYAFDKKMSYSDYAILLLVSLGVGILIYLRFYMNIQITNTVL